MSLNVGTIVIARVAPSVCFPMRYAFSTLTFVLASSILSSFSQNCRTVSTQFSLTYFWRVSLASCIPSLLPLHFHLQFLFSVCVNSTPVVNVSSIFLRATCSSLMSDKKCSLRFQWSILSLQFASSPSTLLNIVSILSSRASILSSDDNFV